MGADVGKVNEGHYVLIGLQIWRGVVSKGCARGRCVRGNSVGVMAVRLIENFQMGLDMVDREGGRIAVVLERLDEALKLAWSASRFLDTKFEPLFATYSQ